MTPPEPLRSKPIFSIAIANGFGLGMMPVASGTWGMLLGLPLAWGMHKLTGGAWLPFAALSLLLTVLAIPPCDRAEKWWGKKDDGRIVADEWMVFPVCMIGLTGSPWWVWTVAFLAGRFFDIVKFPPARGLQRLTGGLGIVIDDFFAMLYTLVFNHAVVFAVGRWFPQWLS